MTSPFFTLLFIGILSTLIMDILTYGQKRLFKVPSLNYCLVGRWVCLMRFGHFHHKDITQSAPQGGECAWGWIIHYVSGVLLCAIFLRYCHLDHDMIGLLGACIGFGLISTVLPFFILQPAFGLGVAAHRSPKPMIARLRSLIAHSYFGFGLFISLSMAKQMGFVL